VERMGAQSGMGVVGQPLFQHSLCKADVPTDPYAWKATSPHGFVDPARSHGEQPGCLLRAQQWILQPRIRTDDSFVDFVTGVMLFPSEALGLFVLSRLMTVSTPKRPTS
jgi:hypothetical protein